jgi:hypothetical protein
LSGAISSSSAGRAVWPFPSGGFGTPATSSGAKPEERQRVLQLICACNREIDSHKGTHRWRETDSNIRSPARELRSPAARQSPFSRRNGTCKAVSKDPQCRRQKSVRI